MKTYQEQGFSFDYNGGNSFRDEAGTYQEVIRAQSEWEVFEDEDGKKNLISEGVCFHDCKITERPS